MKFESQLGMIKTIYVIVIKITTIKYYQNIVYSGNNVTHAALSVLPTYDFVQFRLIWYLGI